MSAYRKGQRGEKASPRRSQARLRALRKQGRSAASRRALSRQAYAAAHRRGASRRAMAARKAVFTSAWFPPEYQ